MAYARKVLSEFIADTVGDESPMYGVRLPYRVTVIENTTQVVLSFDYQVGLATCISDVNITASDYEKIKNKVHECLFEELPWTEHHWKVS